MKHIREIAKVAKLYHVELIPAFDSPGHMNYIVKKYNEHYGVSGLDGIGNYYHYDGKTAIVQGSRNTEHSRGIDISNEKAVTFTRDLMKEYAALFKELGSTKFDIGGDELLGWGASIDASVPKWQQLDHWKTYAMKQTGNNNAVAYDGFLLYMNDLYTLLSSEPYRYTSVRMWNDDALRTYDTGYTGVVTLNKNIAIQYWTDTANHSINSVHTFLKEGHNVYNFINTYNYYAMLTEYYAGTFFPKTNQESIYNNWNPYVFDESSSVLGSDRNATAGDAGIKGSTLCVWCDNPSLRTDVQVVTELIPLIRANGTKAWDYDANSTVSYSTFVNNLATIGDVPTVPIAQSQ
jgi:N-acetyl-beta-hexosaminidase